MKRALQRVLLAFVLLTVTSCASHHSCFSAVTVVGQLGKEYSKNHFENLEQNLTNLVTGKEIPVVTICKFTF